MENVSLKGSKELPYRLIIIGGGPAGKNNEMNFILILDSNLAIFALLITNQTIY